jgi:prepilin-type N-terminal cleavage/methylation domain-containing protein
MDPGFKFRRGFSFTEVLFAVMILGIGFIMVAAIFPVAIQQAKTSTEETTGAAVGRGAANYLEKVATNFTMPATDDVVVGPNFDVDGDDITLSTAIRGSLVIPSNPRVAWLPFYRRAGVADKDHILSWSAYAQVYMIPVQIRNRSEYTDPQATGFYMAPAAVQGPNGNQKTQGRAVIRATIVNGANAAADTIEFRDFPEVAAEGAYVIIADARKNVPAWDAIVAPSLHGRIYRLGNPDPTDTRSPVQRWELMPGSDYEPLYFNFDNLPTSYTGRTDGKERRVPANDGTADPDLRDLWVFVVGRGLGVGGREGTAQDVSAYTTFVNVQ